MPPRPLFNDKPLTPAEKQARYREKKARESDQAAHERLYDVRHTLWGSCRAT
jgi:hypothetical protein